MVTHLSGFNGPGQVFPQDSSIIGQILVHHLIVREEEQVGFGAFNCFFVIPTWKEKQNCYGTYFPCLAGVQLWHKHDLLLGQQLGRMKGV